ncbi:decaprenyl-phosphate phosphoribosyltransferase [Massilia sp. IC2-278]|uniref:decaprenyl-phosphate phosphoribosyltransferase n=1 Tax=Massilia sp. IC2-278 TaxID=2887200 RepID=UPI001E2CD5BB|nr:decaprenyl-phosphate phosphoribosyltransferase [Massilia sp. IC2-278]MCC2960808.1 decaprenyl-phosphate phosphoribosyltransferase [Massilia sp. IC2-278]
MRDPVPPRTLSGQLLGLVKLIRPRQWIKNAFVLAPLIFTSEFMRAESVSRALTAVLLFCIASSATYIVNDMHDVERDRRHPTKSRSRPLAAGTVSMGAAGLMLALLYGALVWGWFVMPATMLVIVGYLALNLAYTFVLKHEPVVDIFTIAIGFVLRVYAGATALNVPVSSWMFVTTLCLALYLAAVKRRQELSHSGDEGRAVLQKYSVGLVDRYAEMSATGALVFYSLFVMSSKPEMVMTVPLVLFGLFRYWYVVEQLDGGESPTDVMFADWQLVATVLAWLGVCGWALWPVA